jgi:hypothetical protein
LESTHSRPDLFIDFFNTATGGFTPYRWQLHVALDGLPDVLSIPTGLGKREVALVRQRLTTQPRGGVGGGRGE